MDFLRLTLDQIKPEQELVLIDQKGSPYYKKINGIIFLFDSSLSVVDPSVIQHEINMLEKMYFTFNKLKERIDDKDYFDNLSSLEQKYAVLEVERFRSIYYKDEEGTVKNNFFIKNKITYYNNYDENSYQTAQRLNLWFKIL